MVLAYESDPRLCGPGPLGVLVLGYFLIPGYVDPRRGGTGPRLSSSIQISLSPQWHGPRLLSTWIRAAGVVVLAYPAPSKVPSLPTGWLADGLGSGGSWSSLIRAPAAAGSRKGSEGLPERSRGAPRLRGPGPRGYWSSLTNLVPGYVDPRCGG